MITVRSAEQRGRGLFSWLNSYHSFSFANYYDEHWMGFGALRVINEDVIQPSSGFDMHSHHDMEIITYVVSGALEHKDNMGNGSIIRPGEIQRMSAGSGVRHSEFNHSTRDELHLLQIWIIPLEKGIQPSYEQKQIQHKINEFILIGSPKPSAHALLIHQRVNLYVGHFKKNATLTHHLAHQSAWLQLVKGTIQVNGHLMHAGDGVALSEEQYINLECIDDAELLFFEMY